MNYRTKETDEYIDVYAADEHGKKHGLCKRFSKDGILWLESTFEHGVREGPYKSYAIKDGVLRSSGYYVNGKKHGVHCDYNQSGKVYLEYTYYNGEKDKILAKYKNGRAFTREDYKKGKSFPHCENMYHGWKLPFDNFTLMGEDL